MGTDPGTPRGPLDSLTGDWDGVSGAMLQLSWGVPGEPGGDGVGHRSPLAPGDTGGEAGRGRGPCPSQRPSPGQGQRVASQCRCSRCRFGSEPLWGLHTAIRGSVWQFGALCGNSGLCRPPTVFNHV